jgi:hypothetical protein
VADFTALTSAQALEFIALQINHEDDLIVSRVAGLLAAQAFAFYVYYLDHHSHKRLVACVGIAVSGLLYAAILDAVNVFLYWKNLEPYYLEHFQPPITLAHPFLIGFGFLPPLLLPPFFAGYWIFVEFWASSRRKLFVSIAFIVFGGLLIPCYFAEIAQAGKAVSAYLARLCGG